MIESLKTDYRKFYDRNRLAYTLKTGKLLKRKELHKRLVYLSKQSCDYNYSHSITIAEGEFDRRTELNLKLKNKDEQVELVVDTFQRYIKGCELSKCFIIGEVTNYDEKNLIIWLNYKRDNIDWVSMDEELITNHYHNIHIHHQLKIPYITETRLKWWEILNLNLN